MRWSKLRGVVVALFCAGQNYGVLFLALFSMGRMMIFNEIVDGHVFFSRNLNDEERRLLKTPLLESGLFLVKS